MDLVPMEPSESEDNKTYLDLVQNENSRCFYAAYFYYSVMSEMIPNNAVKNNGNLRTTSSSVLSPGRFYATWMFFCTCWKSVITWNLNMFTPD
jgi:Cu2+-exporting ATPase